jgi:hypothetical protein
MPMCMGIHGIVQESGQVYGERGWMEGNEWRHPVAKIAKRRQDVTDP